MTMVAMVGSALVSALDLICGSVSAVVVTAASGRTSRWAPAVIMLPLCAECELYAAEDACDRWLVGDLA